MAPKLLCNILITIGYEKKYFSTLAGSVCSLFLILTLSSCSKSDEVFGKREKSQFEILYKYCTHTDSQWQLNLTEVDATKLGICPENYNDFKESLNAVNIDLESAKSRGVDIIFIEPKESNHVEIPSEDYQEKSRATLRYPAGTYLKPVQQLGAGNSWEVQFEGPYTIKVVVGIRTLAAWSFVVFERVLGSINEQVTGFGNASRSYNVTYSLVSNPHVNWRVVNSASGGLPGFSDNDLVVNISYISR